MGILNWVRHGQRAIKFGLQAWCASERVYKRRRDKLDVDNFFNELSRDSPPGLHENRNAKRA